MPKDGIYDKSSRKNKKLAPTEMSSRYVTPQDLYDSLQGSSNTIIYASNAILIFVYLMISMQIIEQFMLHMHKNEALNKAKLDKVVYTRRGVCIAFEAICIVLLIAIDAWANDNVIKYLSASSCASDETLNSTFDDIELFYQDSNQKMWINLIFLILILIVDIGGLVEKLKFENSEKSDQY